MSATVLRGRGVECPLCDSAFRRFERYRGRTNARCPRCHSLERHRYLGAFLAAQVGHLQDERALHFAPEPSIAALIASGCVHYTGADLRPHSDVAVDIAHLPFRDGGYSLVVCSHVLEHVKDDSMAMTELLRVLASGGRAVIQVPMTQDQQATDEDASLPPDERARRFGQADHVRLYGMDIVQRLESVGFRVTIQRAGDVLGPDHARYAVPPGELIFLGQRLDPLTPHHARQYD